MCEKMNFSFNALFKPSFACFLTISQSQHILCRCLQLTHNMYFLLLLFFFKSNILVFRAHVERYPRRSRVVRLKVAFPEGRCCVGSLVSNLPTARDRFRFMSGQLSEVHVTLLIAQASNYSMSA